MTGCGCEARNVPHRRSCQVDPVAAAVADYECLRHSYRRGEAADT
ncbi:hypothetical protein AS9A_3332 [Hoyosella subflava DQS3-9A1]|uniref:Uncharacterized protein n=1 Tax=Hoyosella subflava (strain DSM 45089 / JCM 17490 / NBRC 109087 / DQS3-9A1) TaxID=443218 RepID=F6EPB4_HOYSD|nr:hypothetical protein AS9A_3332 [Hoyosella subflava DQS3-9A1]